VPGGPVPAGDAKKRLSLLEIGWHHSGGYLLPGANLSRSVRSHPSPWP